MDYLKNKEQTNQTYSYRKQRSGYGVWGGQMGKRGQLYTDRRKINFWWWLCCSVYKNKNTTLHTHDIILEINKSLLSNIFKNRGKASSCCLWQWFLDYDTESTDKKGKTDQLDNTKFLFSQSTQSGQWKDNAQNGKKCLLIIYLMRLISRISKELLQLNKNPRTYLVTQMVKKLPAIQESWVWYLGWEDLLEKGIATHFSTLAWRIPRTEEHGGLQSMGSQRAKHELSGQHFHFQVKKWVKD